MSFLKAAGVVCVGMLGLGSAEAAFVDRGGGLVYDDIQNVTWINDLSMGGRQTWSNAMTWAGGLIYTDSLYGQTYDDWRLPTSSELQWLLSSQRGYLYLFNNIHWGTSDWYWSSTTVGTLAAVSRPYDGAYSEGYKTSNYWSWAVRSGDTNKVPEPMSIALLGLGLAGLGWSHRRKRIS